MANGTPYIHIVWIQNRLCYKYGRNLWYVRNAPPPFQVYRPWNVTWQLSLLGYHFAINPTCDFSIENPVGPYWLMRVIRLTIQRLLQNMFQITVCCLGRQYGHVELIYPSNAVENKRLDTHVGWPLTEVISTVDCKFTCSLYLLRHT
jgi:hypothetical protein